MNTLQELQEKEKRLADRVQRLSSSIVKEKQNLTEGNIPAKAKEIHSLEIQLDLTESTLERTQKKITELKKLFASKEYKDKLKQQENLKKQAVQQTKRIYEKLLVIQQEAKEVFKLCDSYDKLHRETSKHEGTMQYYLNLYRRQPFSWLQGIFRSVNTAIDRAKYISDKLEV